MPELPEVEYVRRSLRPLLVGALVTNVQLRRRDVVRGATHVRPRDLLKGATVRQIARHGKDLAIVSTDGRTLGVHLGMTGWLSWHADTATGRNSRTNTNHIHCIWHINGPRGKGVLRFRDPRRFGGLWVYASVDEWKQTRLANRGPDALSIKPHALIDALIDSRRPIKAALLDQSVLAGVGNIYADESLFAAGIHPGMSTYRFARDEALVENFAVHLRSILRHAIRFGGSTVRSFRGVNGDAGHFTQEHAVYGRAGERCLRCSNRLRSIQLAQRTTVFCPHCQTKSYGTKRQHAKAVPSEDD